jgi:hypothetical protein
MPKSLHCPITGVNIPRLLLSSITGFVFIFALDFLIHGNLLTTTYEQTPQLWRDPDTMMSFFPYMLGTQFLIALITAFIFTRNYEGKGLGEGLRFGILLGLFMGVLMSASFAWMPISPMLAASWFGSGVATGLGLGLIFALTYSK